jgi:uncharacterized cupredoxin-like copper-binding protein
MQARVIVCTLAAVIAATIALVGGASAQSTKTTVTVKMKEFKFALSKSTVPAGTVTFNLQNAGLLAHDFKINGKKSALIKAGKSGSLTVTLKAGSYKYICTVPGHDAAGMHGKLKVS